MVDARQIGAVRERLDAEQRPFVRAAVHHRAHPAVGRAHQEDRRCADVGGLDVPGLGDLGLETEKIPGWAAEDQVVFARVDRGVGEDGIGNPPVAFFGPGEQSLGAAQTKGASAVSIPNSPSDFARTRP